jgi:kumamolisin
LSSEPSPLPSEELTVKAAELQVRKLEAAKAVATLSSPWWRRADPLVLAILAGVLTLLGNMIVTILNNYYSSNQEHLKATDDFALEQSKARYTLVLQAMATNDRDVAKCNIRFFIDAGLLDDSDFKIREAIEHDQPVLPSLSGVAPPGANGFHSATEIATLYNFPAGFDGRGVTIGILEFGGNIIPADSADYFKSLNLPVPDIAPVFVDEFKSASDEQSSDGQVMTDVEIAGAIAPGAHIRVYFAPYTSVGFAHAIARAMADGAAVLSIGWGQVEDQWKDEEIRQIDDALKQAAGHQITVVVGAGDSGVTDGLKDGRRHVDFPASSPWVLSIGGTALKSENGRITSETVWRSSQDIATGGGVSWKFERPEWQSAVSVPNRDDGKSGRGIPDVTASADPALGVPLRIHGSDLAMGGTSAAVPVWAGLIARIDQALGYNVGYLNPRLYRNIGPEGVLRTIRSGDNGTGGIKGYSAAPGWSPVAGWGSPDGMKLLSWLRDHPDSPSESKVAAGPCRPSSR